MKVALLIGGLGRGGAERQLMRLAKGLHQRGHSVEVWCYAAASDLDEDLRQTGITVRTNSGGSILSKVLLLRRWMAEFDPDIAHGFMKRASNAAALARFGNKRPKVLGSDFSTATYGKHKPSLWASLVLFAFADGIATQTGLNKRNLIKLAPWLRDRVHIVRNGIDTDLFSPVATKPDNPKLIFASVGTVYHVKNPIKTVEAAHFLNERLGEVFHIDWYGRKGLKGDTYSSKDYQKAIKLVAKYGLETMITFHGEVLDVQSAYRKSDVLLHPSVQEGFPNSVVEAMCCELPIAVSRVSDLPEVIETARNGVLFNESDPVAIADAMEKMIRTKKEERRSMGRRSRELAVKWFGIQRFVDEYIAVYESLVSKDA